MKNILAITIMAVLAANVHAQTLDECQQAAERNYPLIKQYGLIAQTTNLTERNIQTGWFPKVTAYAQASLQNDVMSWPESMNSMFSQLGVEMKGLRKDQYKVGIDVQQIIYDGGEISNQRNIAQQQGIIQDAQTRVTMYHVRKRVNDMYFALLLLNEQIKLNEDIKALLISSEKQLSNMAKSGIAATSDHDHVMAERLSIEQRDLDMKAQRHTLQTMLSLFCGIEVKNVVMPVSSWENSSTNNRPELLLFNAQLQLVDKQEKLLHSQIRPKVGVFAQGYYGYPGFNMFEDMMRHDWSLNGMIGVRLSWNIGALYTHRNDKAKLQLIRKITENERDIFLFNNHIENNKHSENIHRYRSMMQCDDEIITLRTRVRKAAESKLAHGIIDTNSLLHEINNENAAKIQKAIHEISMLREIYDLKYTTNE